MAAGLIAVAQRHARDEGEIADAVERLLNDLVASHPVPGAALRLAQKLQDLNPDTPQLRRLGDEFWKRARDGRRAEATTYKLLAKTVRDRAGDFDPATAEFIARVFEAHGDGIAAASALSKAGVEADVQELREAMRKRRQTGTNAEDQA